jgi:pyridoxamine 5'-phosphate oxidase
MAIDPVKRFNRWFSEARRAGITLPEACAMATVDSRGRPTLRYLLLKQAGPDGFVFYTNAQSDKGEQLRNNPAAALAFYWDATGRQVRIEGTATLLSADTADKYWATRPRGSQLAAAVSQQSRTLFDRSRMMAEYRHLEKDSEGRDIKRPDYWKGYSIKPRRIEFWTRREPRLHHRELFVRRNGEWTSRLLQP